MKSTIIALTMATSLASPALTDTDVEWALVLVIVSNNYEYVLKHDEELANFRNKSQVITKERLIDTGLRADSRKECLELERDLDLYNEQDGPFINWSFDFDYAIIKNYVEDERARCLPVSPDVLLFGTIER